MHPPLRRVAFIRDVHAKAGESGSEKIKREDMMLEQEVVATRQELQAERKKREAERAGRIRAEAALRKRVVCNAVEEAPVPYTSTKGCSIKGCDGAAVVDGEAIILEVDASEGRRGGGAGGGGGAGAGAGIEMKVIGRMRSCFRRRFGAPRQGGIVSGSRGMLRLTAECNPIMSTDSLEQFSHVWLLYVFHENTNLGGKAQVKSKVRPPRLDGAKVGLFATRTPHRPNPIGLSLVKLERITDGVLFLSGIDLLDGTPILDVKPYLPSTDTIPAHLARAAAWFEGLPPVDNGTVTISQHASSALRFHVRDLEFYDTYEETWGAIEEILRFDIRSLTMKEASSSCAQYKSANTDAAPEDASIAEPANFHFDNVLVFFQVTCVFGLPCTASLLAFFAGTTASRCLSLPACTHTRTRTHARARARAHTHTHTHTNTRTRI